MGTAVLRSHDCLKSHPHLDSRPPPPMNPSRKKPLSSPPASKIRPVPQEALTLIATNPSRKNPLRSPPASKTRPVRSKPNPTRLQNKENSETRKPLVMGQVTILKRGEDPNPKPKPIPQSTAAVDRRSDGGESSVLCSTNRLGPDPKILPNFSDLKSIYAGPAFISSPAPSSLPFPAFFMKKGGGDDDVSKSENATRGLKFLLRLDEIA